MGNTRVSTDDQRLDVQRETLRRAGCERVYEDAASGRVADRPGLLQALDHALQLQVYTDAGWREGLDVGAAYARDLDATRRESIPVAPADLRSAEDVVTSVAARIRVRDYAPNPGRRCRTCEVRTVCSSAKR